MWQSYEMPASVEEALEALARFDGRAQIIAGGTDLIIELQEGKHTVECLVDITRIPGLDRIEQLDDWIFIGPNVTFRQIKDSTLLQGQARVLAEAAASVGALQIQTVATLAGNVASALPAADGCVACSPSMRRFRSPALRGKAGTRSASFFSDQASPQWIPHAR